MSPIPEKDELRGRMKALEKQYLELKTGRRSGAGDKISVQDDYRGPPDDHLPSTQSILFAQPAESLYCSARLGASKIFSRKVWVSDSDGSDLAKFQNLNPLTMRKGIFEF